MAPRLVDHEVRRRQIILDPWDVIAGLYGRAWRLGLLDEILAMWRMDQVWLHIRGLQEDHSRGVRILWTAMGLKELDADDHPSPGIPTRAEAVLAEAARPLREQLLNVVRVSRSLPQHAGIGLEADILHRTRFRPLTPGSITGVTDAA